MARASRSANNLQRLSAGGQGTNGKHPLTLPHLLDN